MILSFLFHFFKKVFSAIIKVIAYLLVALSLWLPLLYTLVFVTVCGIMGASLQSLSPWFFAGLVLSFFGAFFLSVVLHGRKMKKKVKAREEGVQQKLKKKQDISAEMVRSQKNNIEGGIVGGSVQKYMSYRLVEQSDKENPPQTNIPQEDNTQWKPSDSQSVAKENGFLPFEKTGEGFADYGYASQGYANSNDFLANKQSDTTPNRWQNETNMFSYGDNQNGMSKFQYGEKQNGMAKFQYGENQQKETNKFLQSEYQQKEGLSDLTDNNSFISGFSKITENNTSIFSQQTENQSNTQSLPASQNLSKNPHSFLEKEEPAIFRTKSDPTILIYEYSNRLEYFKNTRMGLVHLKTENKRIS
jgi:membrane protein implicated in regulation of membrane protease activity